MIVIVIWDEFVYNLDDIGTAKISKAWVGLQFC